MKSLYLAADGDDIGRKIEFFIVMNQMDSLSDFSHNYQSAMLWLVDILSKDFDAKIVFYGGDSLLASLTFKEYLIGDLEKLRVQFAILSHTTLSFGIGSNPRQAYFALKLAKASGKNKIEVFQEYSR